MGLINWLTGSKSTADLLSAGTTGLASPWAEPGNLVQVVASDVWNLDLSQFPLSRAEAISIPAVSKARNLLISSIANTPLVALNTAGPLAVQPSWLYRTDGNVTPFERMAWTVDDLVFFGYSLWHVTRGSDGFILAADYVPMSDWKITNGHIQINDRNVDESEVLFINSPFEGLLTVAARKLREARDIETQLAQRVSQPIPLTVIRHVDGATDTLDQTEITDLLTQWQTARRSPDGALGYLPAGLTIETHGEQDPAMFLEARNAIVTNVGQFLNVRAAMLDGTSSIDSLTYVTKDGERNSFFEFDLPFWTAPIEARLSQDDCVPRGTRVRFDFTEKYNSPTPTGAPVED